MLRHLRQSVDVPVWFLYLVIFSTVLNWVTERKWVLLAIVVGWAVSYYIMLRWRDKRRRDQHLVSVLVDSDESRRAAERDLQYRTRNRS